MSSFSIDDRSPDRARLIEVAQGEGPEALEALDVLLVQDHGRIRAVVSSLGIEPQDRFDALQSGYLGYMRAAKAYRFDAGASLWTFAKHYVKGQIYDDILPLDCGRPRRAQRESGGYGVLDIEDIAAIESVRHPFVDVVAERDDIERIMAVLTITEKRLVATLASDVNQAAAGRVLGITPMSVSRARRRIAAKAKEVMGLPLVA